MAARAKHPDCDGRHSVSKATRTRGAIVSRRAARRTPAGLAAAHAELTPRSISLITA